jgi:ribosomal protein L12E/L44/L45/RPP1/RPP2
MTSKLLRVLPLMLTLAAPAFAGDPPAGEHDKKAEKKEEKKKEEKKETKKEESK